MEVATVELTIKAVFIICEKDFHEESYNRLRKRMEEQDIQVTVATLSGEVAHGHEGPPGSVSSTVKADLALLQIDPGHFQILVIIGCNKSNSVEEYASQILTRALIQTFAYKGKQIIAVGNAVVCLAKSGILDNVPVSSFDGFKAHQLELDWRQDEMVISNNVITLAGTDSIDRIIPFLESM